MKKQTLLETITKKDIVIATGGGIVLDDENQQLIKNNGKCVWLDADINTILKRLDTDQTTKESPSLLPHKKSHPH